jgi:hypothetical protein
MIVLNNKPVSINQDIDMLSSSIIIEMKLLNKRFTSNPSLLDKPEFIKNKELKDF